VVVRKDQAEARPSALHAGLKNARRVVRLKPGRSRDRSHAGREIVRIAHVDPQHLGPAGIHLSVQIRGPRRDPVLVRIGTAVGIYSALWVRSDTPRDEAREVAAARRAVADELGRLAAFLERCLIDDVPPSRAEESARASDVIPPLRRWQDSEALLAGSLREEQWHSVSLAIGQWALVYDAITAVAAVSEWPAETHQSIADLHVDTLDARAALRDETEGASPG
jgi:hypothetical protein